MLSKNQIKCLELMVLGTYTQREISKEIKVSEQTICSWKKNDEFMEEYNRLVRGCIQSLASRALRTMIELLDATSESVRYNAAKDILDRAGFKPEENLTIKNTATDPFEGLSTEELKKLIDDA